MPIPASRYAAAITTVGAAIESSRRPGTVSSIAAQPTSRIRRGLSQSIRRPPTTSPAASAPRMKPHAAAPPSSSRAMVGPSTYVAPLWAAFMNPNATTIVQSHVRELNSRQPSRSSASMLLPSIRCAARQSDRAEKKRGGEVGGAVEGQRPAGADRSDEHASGGRADDLGRAHREAEQRVRLLQHRRRHGLRDDPGRGGEEERGRPTGDELQHDEVPELGGVGQEQRRDGQLREPADDVRAHHHELAREPVRHDPPDEQEDHLRDHSRREHDPERGRRAGQVEDGERERDRSDRAPEERGRCGRGRGSGSRALAAARGYSSRFSQ